jgi:hypothetical protein
MAERKSPAAPFAKRRGPPFAPIDAHAIAVPDVLTHCGARLMPGRPVTVERLYRAGRSRIDFFAAKAFPLERLLVWIVGWDAGDAGVAKKLSIAETLRRTSDQLKSIRKHVANGGHVDQMQEVDALVGLAKEVADRQLAGVESLADENDGSVQDDDDAKD